MKHDLNDLRLFVDVAEAGGYAAASRRTGMPRATISRRIAQMEAQLGLRLIERSSRAFRLSAAGEGLFARARHAVAEAEAAFEGLDASVPRGLVRFSVPPSLLQLSLDAMLREFLRAHPQVSLQIEATNRRTDILREGLDFAIRAAAGETATLEQVMLPLASVDHVLAVAPGLAGSIGSTLEATLARIPALCWATGGAPASWRLRDAAGAFREVTLTPRLAVEDMALLRDAALEGLGMALLPRFLVARDIDEGRLLPVELDLRAPQGRIHAVHLGQKGMRPAVRHLLDWLKRGYRDLC